MARDETTGAIAAAATAKGRIAVPLPRPGGTLKALHNDPEPLLLRPASSPTCVHHLKPLDLGAALITVHRDRFLIPMPLRKAAAAGGVPTSQGFIVFVGRKEEHQPSDFVPAPDLRHQPP